MGLLDKLFSRRATPAEFWTWFAANSKRLEGPPDSSSAAVRALSTKLRRVHPQLMFQLGGEPPATWNLEISADGARELIPVVREMVAAAPSLPSWTVHAFLQPKTGVTIKADGLRYSSEDVRFELRRTGTDVYLDLFIAGFDDNEGVARLAVLLLVSTIGELAAMTAITATDIHDLSACSDSARPLTELPLQLHASN